MGCSQLLQWLNLMLQAQQIRLLRLQSRHQRYPILAHLRAVHAGTAPKLRKYMLLHLHRLLQYRHPIVRTSQMNRQLCSKLQSLQHPVPKFQWCNLGRLLGLVESRMIHQPVPMLQEHLDLYRQLLRAVVVW